MNLINSPGISSLPSAEGITIWKVNQTSTDLLLKKGMVEGARRLLSNANVTYEIVIEDLQEAIANENPPKEVIEQFQNRKGKSTMSICLEHVHWVIKVT